MIRIHRGEDPPEVLVALVGGKSPEQVAANTRFVNDLSEQDLAEIEAILEDAPEISWGITNGGSDTSLNNDARAKVGLPSEWYEEMINF